MGDVVAMAMARSLGGHAPMRDAKRARITQAMARSFAGPSAYGGAHGEPPEEEDVAEVLVPDPPFRVQHWVDGPSDTLDQHTAEPVRWPWQTDLPHRGVMAHKAVPIFGRKPIPSKADALLEAAMLASSAGGDMGENTTGVRAWKEFCAARSEPYLRPLDPNASLKAKLHEEMLCMQFVCELVQDRDIRPTTAANYLGHVQGFHAKRCGVKLCGGLKLSRLPAMLKGLRRLLPQAGRAIRRGIAPQTLKLAMDIVLDPKDPLHANIRAALAVALQGLLRSAEYSRDASKKQSLAKIMEKLPSREDVSVLDWEKLVLMVCPCKNMHHLSGKTVPLVIGAGGSYVDSVAEVRNLLQVDKVRDSAAQPLYQVPLFRDPSTGLPLSGDYLREVIRDLMIAVGEDPTEFGTHSLRIGGATALFAGGATPTVIRTMGRWSSDCYRLYVRACYEQSLEWTRKCGSTKVTDIAADYDEVDDY